MPLLFRRRRRRRRFRRIAPNDLPMTAQIVKPFDLQLLLEVHRGIPISRSIDQYSSSRVAKIVYFFIVRLFRLRG